MWMETTLHRQLKTLYAGPAAACEVRLDSYRIDAIVDGQLIEIQQASLGALRAKVQRLLQQHPVLVVKPLFARKTIVRQKRRSKQIVSRRASPYRATVWDLFLDLVHFVTVFPHPRLTVEVVLAEIEEQRWERKKNASRRDDKVIDRALVSLLGQHTFRTTDDLLALLPNEMPEQFTTSELATALDLPRWWAQKVAYCLRHTGALAAVRRGRAGWVYSLPHDRAA